MTETGPPIDYLDYTRIPFPSDQITIRDLRRAHADLIDVDPAPTFFETQAAADTVGAMLYSERLLARAAYEAALAKPGSVMRDRGLDRDTCLSDLTRLYARYGVAQGAHQTEQLVRAFESRAVSQADARGR